MKLFKRARGTNADKTEHKNENTQSGKEILVVYANGNQKIWEEQYKPPFLWVDPWYCMAKFRATIRCCKHPIRAIRLLGKGKIANSVCCSGMLTQTNATCWAIKSLPSVFA